MVNNDIKFLTFDYLLKNNIHLDSVLRSKDYNCGLYKVTDNSCVLNLTYTSIYLYKLYKLFYFLSVNNLYVTFIYSFKFYNKKFIKFLLQVTDNNYFNNSWINGLLTNKYVLKDIFIIYNWVFKIQFFGIEFDIPKDILFIYDKFKRINISLKSKDFSKFIFLFNLDFGQNIIKESLYTNRFLFGVCSLNFDVTILDFYLYSNNINEVSLNLILKLITTAYINSYKRLKGK